MLRVGHYDVEVLEDRNGRRPYSEWLANLDSKTRGRVLARAIRLKTGQFGDYKAIGDGVYELRLFFGSGYRVYFATREQRLILLLGGGDKSSQRKDIKLAKQNWQHYLEES